MGKYSVLGRVVTLHAGVPYATHADRSDILEDMMLMADQYGMAVELRGADGALVDTIEPATVTR